MGMWHLAKRKFIHRIWNALPGALQILISRIYASAYTTGLSRTFIKPFCWLNSLDDTYLNQFRPASFSASYQNFQDFFTRGL